MQQQLQMAMASNLYNEGGSNAHRGSPLRASEAAADSQNQPSVDHSITSSRMLSQRRGSANQQPPSSASQQHQVTQSQTMNVASSAMGLPPRTNVSWQQSNSTSNVAAKQSHGNAGEQATGGQPQ